MPKRLLFRNLCYRFFFFYHENFWAPFQPLWGHEVCVYHNYFKYSDIGSVCSCQIFLELHFFFLVYIPKDRFAFNTAYNLWVLVMAHTNCVCGEHILFYIYQSVYGTLNNLSGNYLFDKVLLSYKGRLFVNFDKSYCPLQMWRKANIWFSLVLVLAGL